MNFKIMTIEEQNDLIMKAKDDVLYRNIVFNAFKPIISKKVACSNKRGDDDVLEQECLIKLNDLIDKFDYRGNFYHIASKSFTNAINDYYRCSGSVVGHTESDNILLSKINKAIDQYYIDNESLDWTYEDLAEIINSMSSVKYTADRVQSVYESRNISSFDVCYDDDNEENTMHNLYGECDTYFNDEVVEDVEENNYLLQDYIDCGVINEYQASILEDYYICNMSYADIGKKYGVSRQAIFNAIKSAKAKMMEVGRLNH